MNSSVQNMHINICILDCSLVFRLQKKNTSSLASNENFLTFSLAFCIMTYGTKIK